MDNNELNNILIQGLIMNDINYIVEKSQQYLDIPIILVDSEYNLISYSPKKRLDDPLWDSIIDCGDVTVQFIQKLSEENMMELGSSQREPYVIDWGFLKQYPRVLYNLVIDNQVIGYAAFITTNNSEELYNNIKLICQILSICLLRMGNKKITIPDSDTLFLQYLLNNDIKSTEEINDWIEIVHHKYDNPYCVVCAFPKKGHLQDDNNIALIQNKILKNHSPYIPIISNNAIYFLLSDVNDLNQSIEKMKNNLQEYSLCFGYSYLFHQLKDISIYKQQSLFAAKIAREQKLEILNYKYCVLDDIVNQLKENLPMETIIHPVIQQLKEYDLSHQTEYLNTLIVYFENDKSINDTAKALNIHRNTVFYRLNTIKEIGNIDLHDAQTSFHLYLSLYCLKNQF